MTEVAFHFNVAQTLPYVCRLLRKAVNAGTRVQVVGAAAVLATLDRDLWTFAPLEFVAHCVAAAPTAMLEASAVVLTESAADPRLQQWPRQLLLNLGEGVPDRYDAFQRLIEVVSHNEADRLAARDRWKLYTRAGLKLTRHDMAGNTA